MSVNGKLNIKKIKSNLSVSDHEKIMKALGIQVYAENNESIIYYSGEKYKDPASHKPKLYFYKDNKIYVGFTSNRSYDIFALVQTRMKLLSKPCTFMDAVHFVLSVLGIEVESVKRINTPNIYNWEDSLGKFLRFRQTGSTLKIYDDAILGELEDYCPQEWIDEGISQLTMSKYQIGYYERLGATTIPCFDAQGNLIGIRCRHWRQEEIDNGKYRPLMLANGKIFKFPTNEVLFGINWNAEEIKRTGTVFLGESEKFVMQLDTWYGAKSVGLGMFGGNLGIKRRNDLVRLGVSRVIYVPDCDYIGKENEDQAFEEFNNKIIKFAEIWSGYAKVEVVWDSNLNLLGPKENATDRDKATWDKLYEARSIL